MSLRGMSAPAPRLSFLCVPKEKIKKERAPRWLLGKVFQFFVKLGFFGGLKHHKDNS
jgi:hypothetical protein